MQVYSFGLHLHFQDFLSILIFEFFKFIHITKKLHALNYRIY